MTETLNYSSDHFSASQKSPNNAQDNHRIDHASTKGTGQNNDPPQSGHVYPTVTLNDNARAIFGNVYASCADIYGHMSRTEECRTLAQALRYGGMHDRFEQITSAAAETCDWVWTTTFESWLRQPEDNEIFWITGKPGSGKSTLMKYLVQSPTTNERLSIETNGKIWKIVHFFYNFRVSNSLANREEGMLRSVLEQILQTLQRLSNEGGYTDDKKINTIAKESFERDEDAASTIIKFLQLQTVNILMFVDGLDECGSNLRHMVRTLQHIQKQTGIRLCLASRPEAVLVATLNNTKQIKMQELNFVGIQRYAKTILKEIGSLLELSAWSVRTLLEEVTGRADGVFLFVHFTFELIIQRLVQGLTIPEIRVEIRQMPQELSDMYDRMFDGIPIICRSEVAFVLDLVEHGPRPLHLDRLFLAWVFFRTRLDSVTNTSIVTTVDHFKMRLFGLLGTVLDIKDDPFEYDRPALNTEAAELSADTADSKHAQVISLTNQLKYSYLKGHIFAWSPYKRTTVSLMHETVRTYLGQTDIVQKWASSIHKDKLSYPVWSSLYAEAILDTEFRLRGHIWQTLEMIFDATFRYWIPISCQSARTNEGAHGAVATVETLTTSFQNYSTHVDERLAQLQALAVIDALCYILGDAETTSLSSSMWTSASLTLALKSPLSLLYDVVHPIERDAVFDMRYLLKYGRSWRLDLLFAAARRWKSYIRSFQKDVSKLSIDERDYLIGCAIYQGVSVWQKTIDHSSQAWGDELRAYFLGSADLKVSTTELSVLLRWTQWRPNILRKRRALQSQVFCPSIDDLCRFQKEDILRTWAGLRADSWLYQAPNATFWETSFDIIMNYLGLGQRLSALTVQRIVDLILNNYSLRWPLSITVYKLDAVRSYCPAVWVSEVLNGAVKVRLENIRDENYRWNSCRTEKEVYRKLQDLILMLEPRSVSRRTQASNASTSATTALCELITMSVYFGHALDRGEIDGVLEEFATIEKMPENTLSFQLHHQERPTERAGILAELEAVVPASFVLAGRNALSPVSAELSERRGIWGHTSPSAGYAELRHRHRQARSIS